jgi:hypothetical protein
MDQITAEIRKREKGESALSAIFVDPTGIAPRARESILGTGVQSQDLIINPPEGVEVSALYLGDEELKARYIRENRVPEESWVTPQDIITVLVDQLKQNGSE